jgi:hypothetical protein
MQRKLAPRHRGRCIGRAAGPSTGATTKRSKEAVDGCRRNWNEPGDVRQTGQSEGLRAGWVLGSLALLGVATVTVIASAALSRLTPTPPVDEPSRVASMYSVAELAAMRLVAKGYIPVGTFPAEPFINGNLVNQGLLPRETLRANVVPGPSLYSAQERGVMAAVAKGLVPSEALESESFLIQRCINQGPETTLTTAWLRVAFHFLDLETCTRCSDRNLGRFFAGSAVSPTVAGSEEAPCCSPAELQTCCDSEDKAECCGAATGGECGCR